MKLLRNSLASSSPNAALAKAKESMISDLRDVVIKSNDQMETIIGRLEQKIDSLAREEPKQPLRVGELR